MAAKPPPFAQQSYWDQRFREQQDSYDWLQPAEIFDEPISEALTLADDGEPPRILHIGGGTSMLSFHLRAHVRDPKQIHNADYSIEAVEWGRKKEKEMFGFDVDDDSSDDESGEEEVDESDNDDIVSEQSARRSDAGDVQVESLDASTEINVPFKSTDGQRPILSTTKSHLEMPMSIWTQTSLLSLESVILTCSLGAYQVIVDKSCCDAVACGSDEKIPIPYYLQINTGKGKLKSSSDTGHGPDRRRESIGVQTEEMAVHPIHLMGVHIALLAKPGARWLALSYSSDRFPFVRDHEPRISAGEWDNSVPQDLLDRGFPDPGKLWRLVGKTGIESQYAGKDDKGVYRPASHHYLYILERTDVELKVRGT